MPRKRDRFNLRAGFHKRSARMKAATNPARSKVVADDPLRNATWLRRLLAFDRYRVDRLQPVRLLLQILQCHSRANSRISRHRRRKAHPVQAIIHRQPHAALDLNRLGHKMADQGKRQESVSDRGPIRRFFPRPFAVEMNPLPVLSGERELFDALLRNAKPVRDANFPSHEFFQISGVYENDWCHAILRAHNCRGRLAVSTSRLRCGPHPGLLLLASSHFAIDSTCTSSGPSAKRSARVMAQELAKKVS